jgi:hypothetical protein
MGFLDIFGGSTVSPAEVSYAAYSFGADLPLLWPQFANGNPTVAARFMNMTATASGLDVNMPDATLNSVGYDSIIFNAGSNTFNVVTYNGNAIATIAPGQTYYLMLNGNSTQDGTWQTVQFGVGTGSASAAALAGAGLLAIGPLLNVNMNGISVSVSYTLTASARAILQVWTGGSGTITLPAAATVGNGFFFPVANAGSGSLTIATVGSDLIDGAATSVFAQTQSGFVLSTGTGWVTVGKGIQNTFVVTLLNLNVAGNSNVTETSAQAQNIIQQFTGVLTGNITVFVPATVQIYFVYNDTTGPYTLTLAATGGTGIEITQGANAILYCNGTNVVNAFTATITSNLTIPAGSASSPSLNVTGSLSTGLFSGLVNTISVGADGFEVTRFISQASDVNYLTMTGSPTGYPVVIGSAGTDTNVSIVFAPKGSGAVGLPSAIIDGGTIDDAVIGGSTPAAITGTTITANTGFIGHASLDLAIANNLSDVASASASLSNLGGISSATAASTYAPLISPALTGTPTAPTAVIGTSTTQLASTAFVLQAARFLNMQPFSSSGTYTPTTGTSKAIIIAVGGGGGGGGGGGSAGGTGGTTSVGTLISCNGGVGGTEGTGGAYGTGGAGGTVSTGTVSLMGSQGGATGNNTGGSSFGGNGAPGLLGAGRGAGGTPGGLGGIAAAANTGAGGGGGAGASAVNAGGGGGSGGIGLTYVTGITGTYTVTIGAGGSAGGAGSGGSAGSAGGSGLALIFEYV